MHVEYGEVVCVWGSMYMCMLSMGRYVHVHVYVGYRELCKCVC